MGNSTITLQQIVDSARMFGDLAPTLPTGGFSTQPALSIANDVMNSMLLGGPDGSPFSWKWNRFNIPPFLTISWMQDYFVPGVVNLGWIENCWAVYINQTSTPKYKQQVEVHKDLEVDWIQTGYPGKICWMPNDQLQTGAWGVPAQASPSGLTNPGPGVVYTNPLSIPNAAPVNPNTGIADAFNNLWTVTTYGTCGQTNPFLTNLNPVFPTPTNQGVVATTVQDGTTVWTAINPKGQGFRLRPIPPQTGIVWQIHAVGQMRQPYFTSLSQTLEPIPDDYSLYFKNGFYAQCYRMSSDPKIRARFPEEWSLWLKSLSSALKQANREMDDEGFYPTQSIMDSGWGPNVYPSPAAPFGPGGF
jgi:hypothetical protein